MKTHPCPGQKTTLVVALLALVLAHLSAFADEPVLNLPIRFHITQGATMTVKGQTMEVWVTPDDLTGPVIAEVNRIWKPANIQFSIERAEVEPLRKPDDFGDLLKSVENARPPHSPTPVRVLTASGAAGAKAIP